MVKKATKDVVDTVLDCLVGSTAILRELVTDENAKEMVERASEAQVLLGRLMLQMDPTELQKVQKKLGIQLVLPVKKSHKDRLKMIVPDKTSPAVSLFDESGEMTDEV